MKLLVVRHGRTDWNDLRKVQGSVDIELNETGIIQAEEVAEKLKNEKIDLIISSPLKRARKTAEIIRENREIDLIEDKRITERCFGDYEGISPEEMDQSLNLWNYYLNRIDGNVENVHDFVDRVHNFLDEAKDRYADKTVLMVTHGGVALAIRSYFEGMPEDGNLIVLKGLKNCEVREYVY